MRLILLRNVDKLGVIGDIVTVADGYARNCLMPRRIGVEATEDNLRQIEHRKRRLIAEEAESFQKLQALARELAAQSVTIMAHATAEDHLFGSVGAREIADAFRAENLEVDPHWVVLEHPIKEIGCYDVPLSLHPAIEVTAKVWVVRADADEGDRAAGAAGGGSDAPDD